MTAWAGSHDRGDTGRHEPAGTVEPGRAVETEMVDEIGRVGDTFGARRETRMSRCQAGIGARHARVPVISWAAPAPSVR